jgi:hypothetical protein
MKFAALLDLTIDLSMKAVGIYLFFFKRKFLHGSIIFGMSGMYSLSMAAALLLKKL